MKNFNLLSIDKLSLSDVDDNSELIPLMTQEDEDAMEKEIVPEVLPILPLRNMVLFPGTVAPISASRDKSIKLINDAYNSHKLVGVVAQKNSNTKNPEVKDLNTVGTVAQIIRIIKMPDGNITAIIQGKRRFELDYVIETEPYIKASIKRLAEYRLKKGNKEFSAIVESIKDLAIEIINKNPNIPSEAIIAIKNIESDSFLINFVSSNMDLNLPEKQKLLEMNDLKKRSLQTLKHMNTEFQKLELRNTIQSKVRNDLDEQQREYFLQQQLKTIQEELGQVSYESEVQELTEKSKKKKWTKKVKEHFNKELTKLQRMNPQVAEYATQRNYLELLLDLPWDTYSKDNLNIKHAEKVLNRDHYGLEEVKQRILEHLAVLKLRKNMKSPILCFYGPPGVGKTSLGRSIARAINREYVRISLGGLRDEAEIRGHRKTYIGAMPGRIIQSMKKAKASNPVFILDEIDKLTSGHQGDPSSAMLEVLDPEQNTEFYDNFLEIEYDLSKVMFIATANDLSTIHPALRDRMEIIDVSGYTIEEKAEIGKQHLLPKQINEHGLNPSDLKINKPQLEKIIEGYTRESGVRGLNKNIAKVVRNYAKCKVMESPRKPLLNNEGIIDILGPQKISYDSYENNLVAGIVTGLAWTSVGGDILFIESAICEGNGAMNITGNLGKVMKESATIALEYIKSNSKALGIPTEIFKKYNIHIHVPEGATPKDGPSAGITMLTSLVSLLTQKRVKKNLAMTGEVTLRGKVLPVGGIKEKILAAKRAKIKEIILCEENRKDIEKINPSYLKGLTFHYTKDMHDVIKQAITNQKVKNSKVLNLKSTINKEL